MAYATAGLRMVRSGINNEWVLYTVDAIASVLASGYITDGGPTALLPGRGMTVGDKVTVLQVDAIPTSGQGAVGAAYDRTECFVTTVNATTGAVTIAEEGPGGVVYDIALAASSTTDGMDITITVQDQGGNTVAQTHQLEIYMSEAATGIGLTGDTYSGTLTASVGAILSALTAKKHFTVVTAANGIFTGTLVDSANPADQYVVVVEPGTGKLTVSAASGTNWEGA